MTLMTGNQASIYVYAARYAHHRNTGAALQIVNEILRVWDDLPPYTQDQLKREAEEASFNSDDWDRLIEAE